MPHKGLPLRHREGFIHLVEALDHHADRFDHAGGSALAVQHHVAPARRRYRFLVVEVAYGAAGGGLGAGQHQGQQFVGQFGAVAELEGDGVLVGAGGFMRGIPIQYQFLAHGGVRGRGLAGFQASGQAAQERGGGRVCQRDGAVVPAGQAADVPIALRRGAGGNAPRLRALPVGGVRDMEFDGALARWPASGAGVRRAHHS